MLAANSTCLPSLVTDGAETSFAHSAFWSAKAWAFWRYSATSASLGLTSTLPSKASTISKSPSLTTWVTSLVPTIAGISRERAIMAEWDVRPPIFVTKARTYFLFNCAVSLGVKSWAMTMASSEIVAGLGNLTPKRAASTRSDTSLMSAARSCMYGLSSIDLNNWMNMPLTSRKAASAFTFSLRIVFLIWSVNSGSPNTNKWASKTCASCSPKASNAKSRMAVISSLAWAKAASKRATSASVSATATRSKLKSGSVNK